MSTPELYILTATLKSGATVSTEVVSASYGITRLGYKVLNWNSPDNPASQLLHLDMEQVAALTLTRKTPTRRDSGGPA